MIKTPLPWHSDNHLNAVPQETKTIPRSKKTFWQNLGPALITIGLGLGSGEFILWPYLAANYGSGLLWGALLGITFQLFILLEIQRYSTVKGENIVYGFGRLWKYLPLWVIFSNFIGWAWPGFSATSALLITEGFGISSSHFTIIAMSLTIICGLILLGGKDAYRKVETTQKIAVPVSFVIILILFIYLWDLDLFLESMRGVLGQGDGYNWVPAGLQISFFLGAFAYAGSGGNMLLGQSFYSIEEDHGLGRFATKFKLWDKPVFTKIPNLVADTSAKSMKNFRSIRRDQLWETTVIFWLVGFLTIFMLSYIAQATLYGSDELPEGFRFLILEAEVFGYSFGAIWKWLFLSIGIVNLISVQLGAFDLVGRMTAVSLKALRPEAKIDHNRTYIFTIFGLVIFGLAVFALGINEPSWLIITGAVFNALAMSVLTYATLLINVRFLPKEYQPSLLTKAVLFIAASFYLVLFTVNLFS